MPKRPTSAAILAANLKGLMAKAPDLNSQPKVAKRTNGEVSQATISNILRGQGNATLKNIDALADVFRVPAWLLMHPNLETIDLELLQLLQQLPHDRSQRVRGMIDAAFGVTSEAPAPSLHEPPARYTNR